MGTIAPASHSTDRYSRWYGTSFAAPITTGCVVQLVTANGGKGRAAMQRLLGSLQPWDGAHPGSGPGILNLRPLRTW